MMSTSRVDHPRRSEIVGHSERTPCSLAVFVPIEPVIRGTDNHTPSSRWTGLSWNARIFRRGSAGTLVSMKTANTFGAHGCLSSAAQASIARAPITNRE